MNMGSASCFGVSIKLNVSKVPFTEDKASAASDAIGSESPKLGPDLFLMSPRPKYVVVSLTIRQGFARSNLVTLPWTRP